MDEMDDSERAESGRRRPKLPEPILEARLVKAERALVEKRDMLVDELALSSFGIAAHHSDGISAAHPSLAGVIRRALREAYQGGLRATCAEFLEVNREYEG